MKKTLMAIASFMLAFVLAFIPLTVFAKDSNIYLYEFASGNTAITSLNSNDSPIYIQTPAGMDVLVLSYGTDLTENEKEDLIEHWNDVFKEKILLISDPTIRYNCHSYAWYSQEYETNPYWMPFPLPYFNSPYNNQNSHWESNGHIGDIIVYFDMSGTPIHSGIIVGEINAASNGVLGDADLKIVQSKWSKSGLYTHRGDECPYTYNYTVTPDDPTSYAAYVKYYTPKSHNHVWNVAYSYDDWDKIYCSVCSLTMYHELSIEYVNDSYHILSCSFCGDFTTFSHSSNYVDAQDNLMHHLKCSLCGTVKSYVHQCNSFVDSELDGYHKGVCTVCGGNFYQFHTCATYVNSNMSGYHQGICTVCNDTVYERHEWEVFVGNKYRCKICNYVTKNISALSIEEEMICLKQ